MKTRLVLFFSLIAFFSVKAQNDSLPYVLVLGVAQDGGYPHIGCKKKCCEMAWQAGSLKINVVSLALVDPVEKKWWLFEATPDITGQLHLFASLTKNTFDYLPAGIFITHAHIGHYTGLMQLGREA
ncbi:MAG: pyrroloquinoline quinone biosynthesis protein PqqB, partial [Bacteroidota bacterium]